MNRLDLGAIEHILDSIVEQRVKKEKKEFIDGLMKQYPNLQYDLRKARVAIQDSAFDIFMAPPPSEDYGYNMWSNGLPKHSYLSPYTDIKMSATGEVAESTKFQMTQEAYDEGKVHSNIPVSAFDGLTAYESKYDLCPFKNSSYVPTPEEIAKIPEFIIGFKAKQAEFLASPEPLVHHDDAIVVYKETRSAENTLTLNTQAEHHDKVLASVIRLSKE